MCYTTMIWFLLLMTIRLGAAWMLHTPGGGLLDDRCPCLPPALCPRIFGQSPMDARHFGQLPVCRDANRVRCCGASVTIQRLTPFDVKQGGDYKLSIKKGYKNDYHIKRSVDINDNSKHASNETHNAALKEASTKENNFQQNHSNTSEGSANSTQKNLDVYKKIINFANKEVNSSHEILSEHSIEYRKVKPQMPNSTVSREMPESFRSSLTKPESKESVVLVYSKPFVQNISRSLDIEDDSQLMIVFSETHDNTTKKEKQEIKTGLSREVVVASLNEKKEHNKTDESGQLPNKQEITDRPQGKFIPLHLRNTKTNKQGTQELQTPKSAPIDKMNDSISHSIKSRLDHQSPNGSNMRPVPTLNNKNRLRELFARRKQSRPMIHELHEPEESASMIEEEVNQHGLSPTRNNMEFENLSKDRTYGVESINEPVLQFGQRIVPRLVGAESELRETFVRPVVVPPIMIRMNRGNTQLKMQLNEPLIAFTHPPRKIMTMNPFESTIKEPKDTVEEPNGNAEALPPLNTKLRPRLRNNNKRRRPESLENLMDMMNKEVVKQAFEDMKVLLKASENATNADTFKNEKNRGKYNHSRLNGSMRGLGGRRRRPMARDNKRPHLEGTVDNSTKRPVDIPGKTEELKHNVSSVVLTKHFKTPSSRTRALIRTTTIQRENVTGVHSSSSSMNENLKATSHVALIHERPSVDSNGTAASNASTDKKLGDDLEISETTSVEKETLFKPPESMERGFQPIVRPELHVVGPIPLGFRGFEGNITEVRFAKTLDGVPESQLQLPQHDPTAFVSPAAIQTYKFQTTDLELPTENDPPDFLQEPNKLLGNQHIEHILHLMQTQYEAALQQYNQALEYYNKHYKNYLEKYKETTS